MKSVWRSMNEIILLFCAVLMSAASLPAADGVIRGVVADDAGKPIRGALVRVTIDKMTVNRFSRRDGRFEVAVPPGTFNVTVDAYGFALARKDADTTKSSELNFKLSHDADVTRMSGAELESMLPNTKEAENIKQCDQCHGFTMPMRHAGWVAKDWVDFIPKMEVRRLGRTGNWSPDAIAELGHSLETFFGPNGMWGPDAKPPDLSKVKHTELKDEALKATIKEWTIPTPAMAHSVTVDNKSGLVWFGEYDVLSNKIGRFNPETEKFEEFPLPAPSLLPHTGAVVKDGFVIALARGGVHKMAGVDPAGNITLYDWPEKHEQTHTAKVDPAGKTVWLTAGDETWSWDVETRKFTHAYKNPVPDTFPAGSQAALTALPGQKPSGDGYDAIGDSKGIAWISEFENGILIRLDPKTGEMKTYHTQEMRSVRGIAVDAQDNIWWGDYEGHKLGKLDTKTGAIKLYQPPTPFATPYGVTPDMQRGYIWFADTLGNQVTRFDPKTEQFVEYPLPTRIASVRFNGIDPQGRIWYGGYWNGKLGVIDPEGTMKPAMKPLMSQRH
jgi:streptogramin lyase